MNLKQDLDFYFTVHLNKWFEKTKQAKEQHNTKLLKRYKQQVKSLIKISFNKKLI